MSLTSHLDDKQSPLREFLHRTFPNFTSVLREDRKLIRDAHTLRPEGHEDFSTIGTAIDYRIRYYFSVTPFEDFVAYLGTQWLNNKYSGLVARFWEALQEFLSANDPIQRRMPEQEEDILNKYCYILAKFEQMFRNPITIINSPLLEYDSLKGWLSIPDISRINDLRTLSWSFYDQCRHLLALPHYLNPVFDGSEHVGGADADFIVDGLLVDIKTSIQPTISGDFIYQLLGYALLDYSDTYRIKSVGLYMSRQAMLFQWDLESLIHAAASDSALCLDDLRKQFESIARGLPEN